MRYLKPDQAKSNCPVALNQSIFKVQLDYKTNASRLSYELGANGEECQWKLGYY